MFAKYIFGPSFVPIQKCSARLHVCLDKPVIPDYSLFFQASCLLIYSHKCKQKNHKAFLYPSIFTFMNFWQLKTTVGNRKQQKLHRGPFSDLWRPFWISPKNVNKQLYLRNFGKQILFACFVHLMRCLNCWGDKKFWDAQSVPPSPATSVNALVCITPIAWSVLLEFFCWNFFFHEKTKSVLKKISFEKRLCYFLVCQ